MGSVVVQRVVDEDVVVTAASSIALAARFGRGRVTADRVTARVRLVEYVVAHRNISAVTRRLPCSSGSGIVRAGPLGAIGLADLIFAGRLDAVVGLQDHVPLDRDIGAAVTIESVGVVFVAFTGIRDSADVVDRVLADFPIHSLVVANRTDAFVSNCVDADVVVVVHEVISDAKMGYVAIHIHRFALPGPQVVDLVATDDQLRDGSLRGAVHGDAKSVAVRLRRGRDVVHQIVQNLDPRARACDPDASRSVCGFAGGVIADFKSADGDVAQASRHINKTLRLR